VALAIDASSPATVNQTTTSQATATTASFTPPANSLLVVLWSGDTQTIGTAPTITDNLGAHLTYTLAQWQSTVSGQAAIWTAPVGSSAAMTVTVTNNDTGTFKDAALKVAVLTDGGQPTVGTSSKGTGPTSTTIPMAYTATVTGSWGFAVISDWDAAATQSGGTGTTLISTGTTSDINWGQFRRTTADGVASSTTTINATYSVASGGHAQWVAVEILPNAGSGTNYTRTVDDPAGLTDALAAVVPSAWTFTHNVTIG
jgi:hypothetical protein